MGQNLPKYSNLSVIPTGQTEDCLGNFDVFSCNKILSFYFISKSNCRIMMCEKQGKLQPKLRSELLQLRFIFCMNAQVRMCYCTNLRYCINPAQSSGTLIVPKPQHSGCLVSLEQPILDRATSLDHSCLARTWVLSLLD